MSTTIADIKVGERRREDYGDIAGLAASIEKYGLLHPVVIDDEMNLVAGERRLRACQSLGWTSVETTSMGLLTDAARREIELEENLRRKDLTAYERSRTLTELAQTASQVAKEETCSDSEQVSGKRGPKRTPGSFRDVAERIGVPIATIGEAISHVETADAFPVLQKPEWKQYHVLEAREQLDKLPEEDRSKAVTLIDQPGIPPQAAIPILKNLATMPAQRRETILTLVGSADERDRSLAVTSAAELPPMPDPRIGNLDTTIRELRSASTPFPEDPMTSRIVAVIEEIKAIRAEIKERSRDHVAAVS